MKNKTVKIFVSKGCVDVELLPKGITVIVRDYDCQGGCGKEKTRDELGHHFHDYYHRGM